VALPYRSSAPFLRGTTRTKDHVPFFLHTFTMYRMAMSHSLRRTHIMIMPANVLVPRISQALSLRPYHAHLPISCFFHNSSSLLKSSEAKTTRGARPDSLPFTSQRAGYDPNARLDPRSPPDATSRTDRRAMSREQLRLRLLGDRESREKAEILQKANIRGQ